MSADSKKDNGLEDFEFQRFVRVFLRQRLIVVGSAVLGAVIAASYAFLASPVYEAKVFVMPPSQSDISNLNYGRIKESGLAPYTVKDVYDIYTRYLQAESLRLDFFSKIYVPSLPLDEQQKSRDVQRSEFSEVLRVVPPLGGSSDRYSVVVRTTNPEKAKEWVAEYVAQAGELAKKEIINNVSIESQVWARNVEQQIGFVREKSSKAREDSIAKLDEALRIAESIGLEKPPAITVSQSAIAGGESGQLVYMRGSKALRAEIESIRARKSDDPFTDHLRDLQERYSFFKGLKIEPSVVSVYRQDGVVELPDKPVKPNKALILVLGVIAGLITGIAFVLLRGLFVVRPE